MATTNLPQKPLVLQSTNAELAHFQQEAFENNLDLTECFRGCAASVIEDSRELLIAMDQATALGMLPQEENNAIRGRWWQACKALVFGYFEGDSK